MRILKRVIATVIVILLLELLKKFLNENSRAYTFFYNLISCVQLLFLLYCVFSIFFEWLFAGKTLRKRLTISGLAVFIILMCGLEGLCTFWLYHPKKIPSGLFDFFKMYYDEFDCRIVQYEPTASEYSDSFFYQMKSNARFEFANREFSDSFTTNSAALRDDEHSLHQPEIICIGDSYTLGWGNTQEDNFPAIMEKRTGLKVLNVSMSSYGTARQLLKLQQMDLSNVKYIFWQYCFNDAEENRRFIQNRFTLAPQQQSSFDSVVQLHKWTRTYFPFRHSLTILKLGMRQLLVEDIIASRLPTTNLSTVGIAQEAKDFLDIIEGSQLDFSKAKLVVFELSPPQFRDNEFIKKIGELTNGTERKAKYKGNLFTLDAIPLFTKDDYYSLDVHIRNPGNEKLVSALMRTAGIQ